MLDRRDAVSAILRARGSALLVTGLGSPTWDVAATADSPCNFYLWGAMGGAAVLGLGLALAQPSRRVLVLTGDGELLMGLGGLATIGAARPSNLSVVVLDNERYGETGMQASHTARGVDLAAMARAAGFPAASTVTTAEELDRALPALYGGAGPVLLVVKVLANQPPLRVPLRDGTHIKNRFREALLGPKAFG
ncbi:MAG: aldehyde dehydrogenase [Acidobacteria bacterium RIFCSPLOWO2_02_FULL_68_18]|nr:MAG: aldehyde dehydrogenase [Acidobacteria bacterium RIFCSPLOWO2_02_FULL_68_18]OFW51810.1 MAG: aldehyde dehydrogenase [Acidobacteria bacterium RIFCSPLOWO2_12_FULL_68_19]